MGLLNWTDGWLQYKSTYAGCQFTLRRRLFGGWLLRGKGTFPNFWAFDLKAEGSESDMRMCAEQVVKACVQMSAGNRSKKVRAMGCERMVVGGGIELFVCRREVCFSCGARARARCSDSKCGKPLCDTHIRKVGDEIRCATHAPMTINHSMPRPPPPPRLVVDDE
jgi:hypothetical protein